MYVVGGKTSLSHTKTTYRFDALKSVWTRLADLPSAYPAVENPTVIAVGNALYTIGGITFQFRDS